MALSDITRAAVEQAIAEYDRIGENAFLEKYGFARSLEYWLVEDGRRYVSKAIVGAAHGYIGPSFNPLTSGEFSGGRNTVKKLLEDLEFVVTEPETIDRSEIVPGTVLNNAQMGAAFGIGNMGGMRRNKRVPHLVIISDPFKGLYQDRWAGDVLHYTGMGKNGDQRLNYSQNKTLNLSPQTGEPVHLFEALDPGSYTYVGEVELVDAPYEDWQPDEKGRNRRVWMFPVRPKPGGIIPEWSDAQLRTLQKIQERKVRKLSDKEVERRAKAAKKRSPKRPVTSYQRYRDQNVADYVKRLADGHCDLCRGPAPFNKQDGEAYLECHHIVWLANDGEDSIENAVALCPNCHRRMHVLDRSADRQKLRNRVKERDRD